MSYDIYIGNAELESEWSDDEVRAEWIVNGHAEPDAPVFAFDVMTKNGNSRHPGYSQWANFCRQAGLHALFFGSPDDGRSHEGGLMSNHPGVARLDASILGLITAARIRWQATHPDAIPGFDYDPMWLKEQDDGVRGRDDVLARLLWLEWWMAWALRTCERPAIYNR
jgi:hypothetical protein